MEFRQALEKEKVLSIMVVRGICVQAQESFGSVVEKLQKEEKFCAVILKDDKVEGIFTERDALTRGLLQKKSANTPVSELMTKNPVKLKQNDSLYQAVELMHQGRYRHLPVVDSQEKFVGLISARDIVYFLSETYPAPVLNQPPNPHQVSTEAEGA